MSNVNLDMVLPLTNFYQVSVARRHKEAQNALYDNDNYILKTINMKFITGTYYFNAYNSAFVCKFCGPGKGILTGNRMNGTDSKLEANLSYPLPRHCYPPVVSAVVYHK